MASKQEYAESLDVSKGNARAKRQYNELMVDKGARGTSNLLQRYQDLKKNNTSLAVDSINK